MSPLSGVLCQGLREYEMRDIRSCCWISEGGMWALGITQIYMLLTRSYMTIMTSRQQPPGRDVRLEKKKEGNVF